MTMNLRELLIELVMTTAFVAVVVFSKGHPVVIGAMLALVIYLGGQMGDRANHVNPAITLGLLANGGIKPLRAAALIGTQVLGGIIGVFMIGLVTHKVIKRHERGTLSP